MLKSKSLKDPSRGRKNFRLLFFIFLIFPIAFLFFSCARRPPSPVSTFYQNLSLKDSLLHYPEFKVIDDFTANTLKNKLGQPWQPLDREKVRLKVENSAGSADRFSLNIQYNLGPKETSGFKSSLGRLDMSRAEFLVFRCRHEGPPGVRLEVSLTDGQSHKAGREISNLCSSDWKKIHVPAASLGSLDWDDLTSLEWKIRAPRKGAVGRLRIDDAAFLGKKYLDFESHRDDLIGFPEKILDEEKRGRLLKETNDQKFLHEIASDTWKYFEQARDKETSLIVDHVKVSEAPLAADYTSISNIAMDLLAIVGATDLGFIGRKEAVGRISRIFESMKKMERRKGFFYNFYETKKLRVTRRFVSSADSGWLAVALIVVRQAFDQELADPATSFLNDFDFQEFLDPGNNQLSIGYDAEKAELSASHYGLLATEARVTSFVGIGKGDLPRRHWWFIYRTPPEAWKWQNQTPQGSMVIHDGLDVFEGYYTYQDKKFVPSWGGSLFEFLMPTLVLKERELAPEGLGMNNRIATGLHREYALKEKNYPVWGISPASTSNGKQWRYAEFGVKSFGAKGYPDQGVATPHVSFLALDSLPQEAIQNIRRFLQFPIYGSYGLYDSLNVRNGKVNAMYLALDQGMTFVALCNYLRDGAIQKWFHADSIAKKAEDLLMKESFFKA